jgi:hypothetical protein
MVRQTPCCVVCRLGCTVQAKQRRTGTGESRAESPVLWTKVPVLRMTRVREQTLDISKGRMLPKDDLFEVVGDPGADKREKRSLGQVSPDLHQP